MKKYISILMFLFFAALTFVSCGEEENPRPEGPNPQTIIVFMPWTGSHYDTGLYDIFKQNLDSIEGAIKRDRGLKGRVMVFLSNSAEQSELYEITYDGQRIGHTPVATYTGNAYTTAEGITKILSDAKDFAPALNYAMMIGCHGTGWTYKDTWNNYPYNAKRYTMLSKGQHPFALFGNKIHTMQTPYPTTRFYGSVSDMNYATDLETLATGIENAGIKMQFVTFDDCYMANIESAYALRNAANFLIGSTSEVMAIGMPYQSIWSFLATPTPNYNGVVKAFYDFYSHYSYPYGALSVIDCRKTEKLAETMRTINQNFQFPQGELNELQALDGFNIHIFYDMGDYVKRTCKDEILLKKFNDELKEVVRSTMTTDKLYSYLYGDPEYIKVKTYSGISISDPSTNPVSIEGITRTGWWKATHR